MTIPHAILLESLSFDNHLIAAGEKVWHPEESGFIAFDLSCCALGSIDDSHACACDHGSAGIGDPTCNRTADFLSSRRGGSQNQQRKQNRCQAE
jgi:hypothetical protein